MGQTAQTTDQEYWRPPIPTIVKIQSPPAESCSRCGADLLAGSLFCHICGRTRQTVPAEAALDDQSLTSYLDLALLRRRLGLSVPSLVFFLVGIGCMAVALLVGFMVKTDTLVDWQAVQLWRIEWLLGAAAAMLAGILLKKARNET